ncbi:hypothetical protein MNBD_DELTA01-1019 [hydrothermal vent metagenome]|uniref:Flagellar assembly protein T N-terminal domain-containing protein n=1 Tax=hydrothermal vent metagenome TaxID=652676 RepID=A0A3B0QV36_9ZZZZ
MKILLVIFTSFLLLAMPQMAGAGEVSVLKMEGSAKKSEFEADTKKEALERALRGSVEAAVREVMKGEDILENAELIEERIYPNPMNYILNYRILSEGWITHFDLPGDNPEPEGAEGIDDDAMEGDAGVGVELVVGADGELVAVATGEAVEDMPVEEVGIEGGLEAGKDATSLEGRDAAIDEKLPAPETVTARRHRKGSLAESSFFTPSAEDIEEGVAGGIGEGVMGGELLYHLWVEIRLDLDRLREDVKGFIDIVEVETSTVSIEILGVSDHQRFEELKKGLEETEVVKEIGYESFSRGRYVLRAVVAGTGHDLYDSLKGNLGKDLVLIPGGVGRVIIKLEESAF